MRIDQIITRTNKEAKEFDTINATLLQKAGFIDQTMAGVYSYLPLGLRVLTRIENIIREEMDKVGSEILMPAMVPRELWEKTDRMETDILFEVRGANDKSRKKNKASYILSPTHEEVITPLFMKQRMSYKDLPFAAYQIQTKFRNEERPKSGLLRGREFRMKDLYSFHASDEDRREYYDRIKDVYVKIFDRLGIGEDTIVALAGGGDFTDEFTHEFDTRCESGEDIVYWDEREQAYYNAEVASDELKDGSEEIKVSEVGNIFPLGTKFSEAFGYMFTDQSGERKPVHMASYGIGSSRVMGVIVEKFNDDGGIIWPKSVAPFQVYLAVMPGDNKAVIERADKIYEDLLGAGIEVLYDDRAGVSGGMKLKDADLTGMPWRAVVSEKTGSKVEIKARTSEEIRLIKGSDLLKVVKA